MKDPELNVKKGHEICAYRPHLLWGENEPTATFIDMECRHGFSAGGPFYSHVYVRELLTLLKELDPENKFFEGI